MLRTWTFLLIFLSFAFAACHEQSGTAPAAPLSTNSKAQVLNNIVVHEKGGLSVARAFLSDENGNLLNAQNKINENDTVLLNLAIKEGWISDGGTVSIGASQEITTAAGEPVLSSPDLFAGKAKFPMAKAGFLQLKTVITKTRPDTRSFIVRYRVWDKNGPGEIAGSYKLSVDPVAVK